MSSPFGNNELTTLTEIYSEKAGYWILPNDVLDYHRAVDNGMSPAAYITQLQNDNVRIFLFEVYFRMLEIVEYARGLEKAALEDEPDILIEYEVEYYPENMKYATVKEATYSITTAVILAYCEGKNNNGVITMWINGESIDQFVIRGII